VWQPQPDGPFWNCIRSSFEFLPIHLGRFVTLEIEPFNSEKATQPRWPL
jgi:hypothetical protein